MKMGITMFPADHAMAPDAFAKAVEERGFDSLAFPEHTHIPVSRRTPFPGGIPLPEHYARTHDPFIALTAAAMVTERIELWTGICLIAQRDPIVTAKVIASLDQISDGRFVFGIGYGWNEDEAENHGISFKDRRAIVRERVLAMQQLWSEEEASFHGEHVSFDATWSWPKPQQRPWPKVVLGSGPGPKSFAHIAEFCDGWVPIAGMGSISDALPKLHAALEERGRKPRDVEVTIFGAKPDQSRLDHYREQGVANVFFSVPPAGSDVVLPALDALMPHISA